MSLTSKQNELGSKLISEKGFTFHPSRTSEVLQLRKGKTIIYLISKLKFYGTNN